MLLLHSYFFKEHPITVRSSLIVGATLVYLLIFSLFYHNVGDGLTALAIFPALISGWLLGGRLGLVAGFIIGLLNIGLYFFVGGAGSADILGRSLPSLIVGTIGGGLSGWLRDQFYQLKRQADTVTQERDIVRAEIVQRRQTEIELRHQEEILQQLSDHLPLMIAFYDSTGKVLFLSRELERTLGWSMAELNEIDLMAECYPDPTYRQKVIEFMIAANEEWRDFETRTKDERLIDTTWFNVRLSDGSNIGIGQDITHRKQAEEILRESEEKFRTLAQTMTAGILIHQGQQFIYANPAVTMMVGYSQSELLGMNFWDIVHPDHQALVRERCTARLQGGTPPAKYEIKFLKKSGDIRWVHVTTGLIKYKGQLAVLATVFDITDRKAAEMQLQTIATENLRLARAVDAATDGISISDPKQPDNPLIYVNPAFCQMTGYSFDEMIGQNCRFLQGEDTDPDTIAQVRQAVEERREIQTTILNYRRDGQPFWNEMRIAPIFSEEGELVYFVGIQSDVTHRRQAEAKLRRSEEKWRSLVENSPDFIFIINPDLTVQFLNHKVPGLSMAEIIGIDITHHVPPDYQETARNHLERAFQTGEADNFEIVAPGPNGTMVWYQTRLGPIKHQGQVTALIVVSTDITEQKRGEETLAYARDQAMEASRLKSELLAKVSHELRTPLNAILGFAELLDFGLYGPLTDNQKNAVTQVMESTNYLTKLVNELLDQARLDAGHIKLNLTTFQTDLLLEEVQTKMSVLAEAKGLQLTTKIAETMPDVLHSDRQNIQKILFNLIGNAIKFTEQGEIQVNVYCADAKQWTIEVRDTGAGIPEHALSKIFEPFQQVDGSLTRKHSGSGLGLSIVKQLTELMGGCITVESKFGQGSIFTVLLPMHPIMETENV